jgi:hypothetical protein
MKGWLDNFGKADNANDSNVSLPEGFVGLGYNTKGRNYSPAWGGQFQDGGIIPIAQSGVTEYMNKKMQDKKDATIAKDYNLPEVVVEAIPITQWNDPDKPSGYPQYTPKPGDNVNSPGWDIAEFYKSWVSSPEYERRMKNTGYYDAGTDKFYAKNLKKDIRISYDQYLKNQRGGRMGALESTQEPGFIQIEPALYRGRPASRYTGLGIDIHPEHTKTPEMFETTLAHEIGHAIDSTTNFEDSLITSSMLPWSEFNKPFYSGVDPVSGNPIITQKDDIRREQAKHVRNDPQEFKSDLQALRYLMYDRGVYDIRKGKKFTKEDLERAKEKLKGNQSLERTIQAAGENGLIKLMNIIAKGDEEVTPIAMGGMSIPGSVGFTYARTAGSAPSKGKHAKKTMASAQNGQEMKFYQNGLDWKPKSMQPGGELPLRVSTADPRYPELYKNRQVGSYYDGAFTLPDLPEVVVTGKDERIKEGMSQGSGRFLEGTLGVISAPQVVTMDWLTGKQQTPSEAWGFQNPGGWLDSPTAFGKNALNFGMDMTFDPLNALGVGVVDDAMKIGAKTFGKGFLRSGKDALAPQLDNTLTKISEPSEQILQSSSVSNLSNQDPSLDLSRYQQRFQEKKDEILKNLETAEGRKRLQGLIDKSPLAKNDKLTVDDFIERFKQTKFETEKPRHIYVTDQNGQIVRDANGWPIRDFEKNPDGTIKLYPNAPNEAYHWPREGVNNPSYMYAGSSYTPYDIDHVLEHEFGHFFQYGDLVKGIDKGLGSLADIKLKKEMGSGNFRDVINKLNPFYKNISDLGESSTRKFFGYTNPLDGFQEALRYWNVGGGSGREKYAMAAEVRENLLKSGILKNRYDEITPEMIKQHKKLYERRIGDKYFLRLYDIMDNTQDNFKILSDALNKMPAVALPAAGGAAALTSGLQDEQPVQKQKNGGITKDNRGYWNPDNWGQPVEIDSNMITMQGVYEPLLGISDTGDTKLMQPGKNYKFNGKKVTEFPVAQTGKNTPAQQEVSRQDYLSKFNMYDDVLKSKNYTTPYYKDNNIDTSEGDMNCINGVCYMVSNIAGVKFDKGQTKDTYTGNATFADNAMDEGYYRSNPEKEGFGVGDIFQYARKKGSMGSRFPGEVDFRNENDLYPNHAVLIVNEFVKDGKKYFKVANNSGGDKVEIEDVSESELMNRYKKGYKTFDGGITYRYDPDKVTSIKKENQDKINVLKGKNPYSGQYSKFDTSNLTFFNNKVDGLNVKNELAPDKNLQRYADVYKTVYNDLGKGSNMPIDSFNKLIMNQIGIAGQETKFGKLASNPKDIVPDSLLPYARRVREIYDYNFGEEDNWKKDYWDKNADNVQKEFSSYEDFVKSLDSEGSDYNPYRTPRSIGEFQQKDLSERGNFYKYDLDSFEGQVKSSLALAVDNYHKLKAKYPDLSEDQIIDLTTLMHNAPGKALEPRFVNYYLKRNDVDYIDKVKGFAPKSFGKDQSKNEKIEWKTEKISPEEAKSIADYVRSLPKTKRNGGDVGINQLDAQPMKKLNQLLNFTNNPDKDNWLDKYN